MNEIQLKVTQLNPIKSKSEEEAWLDAVESGDLEQVKDFKRRKEGHNTYNNHILPGGEL